MNEIQNATSGGNLRLPLIMAAVAAFIALYFLLPVNEWLESFQNWIHGFGPIGWIIFIVAYAGTSFFLIPGSIMTIGAGVAYGLWGFPLVIIGATLGSAMSFLAARHLFYDRVQTQISKYPSFAAINEAISEEGWRVVFLLRLSPALPFSLQNWFLGITSVGFWPSQIATFFGIMPGTLLYIWIASLGGEAVAGGTDTSIMRYIGYAIGIVATLAVTIVVTQKARQKLKEYSVE